LIFQNFITLIRTEIKRDGSALEERFIFEVLEYLKDTSEISTEQRKY
jgi:hypothetical protein